MARMRLNLTGSLWYTIVGCEPYSMIMVKTKRFLMQTSLLVFFLGVLVTTVRAIAQSDGTKQSSSVPQAGDAIDELHAGFAHPPDDCRIMMRWWWFGPSATKPEIERELNQMKTAGIGGVEIATLYPLELDNQSTGFRNYPFVSDEHLENIRFAAEIARKLGLRVDITLGSGWPFGGPHIPITQAAGELRVEAVAALAGSDSVAIPALESGERAITAFLIPGTGVGLDLKRAKRLSLSPGSRVSLNEVASTDRTVLVFIASRTGMMVKRAADGAQGLVLDHYDAAAIQNHLRTVGDRFLSAFGDHPPYAVFSDSLEDYGSDWTPDLLEEFQRRRGYDLTPFLPALVGDAGPDTAAVRHDWGMTLTELANERFLQPLQTWAHKHHTLFRSQTYGYPPVTLSSNRFEDLPEGEGKATIDMWRQFSDTRWAASAGHLFHHNVISSETWTWLHSPAFRATPLDMKAEADLHFLQGINQLVGHGWPYSPESVSEPGWRMYAAGAFNAHNPWFFAMPDLSGYLQRVSYAMRLGTPVRDVAVLLPNDDAWATFKARIQRNRPPTSTGGFDESGSNITIDESMPKLLGADVIPQIVDSGFNLDFIDAEAITSFGIPYKVLILAGVDRIPPNAYEKILEFARNGGIVIATRREPATAPGYRDAAAVSAHIDALSKELFHSHLTTAHFIADERTLGESLKSWLQPDCEIIPPTAETGFVHRHLESGDLYFVVNTGNRPQTLNIKFRSAATHAELWDPFTGKTAGIENPGNIALSLAPYESRLVFFSQMGLTPPKPSFKTTEKRTDISHDWQITFAESPTPTNVVNLTSWTAAPDLFYFSGQATYHKTIEVSAEDFRPGSSIELDFGEGKAVEIPQPLPRFNMRAYLDTPVREAAEIFINGHLAGYVWHPPFRMEIAPFLRVGKNDIRLVVGNTAINELAGQSMPSYRLLRDRVGVEFIPQDMQGLEPLPSGLLGPVTLILNRPI